MAPHNSLAGANAALIIEFAALARQLAAKRVRLDVADELAEEVAVNCLLKTETWAWGVSREDLNDFGWRVARRPMVDWRRRQQHAGERNPEHVRDLEDRGPHLDMARSRLRGA
jgi:DNA-directed RNA polymerase specialized sigma24 family protein